MTLTEALHALMIESHNLHESYYNGLITVGERDHKMLDILDQIGFQVVPGLADRKFSSNEG